MCDSNVLKLLENALLNRMVFRHVGSLLPAASLIIKTNKEEVLSVLRTKIAARQI